MPCPRTQHLNNVPRLRGEKHDISLKILHQAGFETARQAATSAERHALTIAPCPSLSHLKGCNGRTVYSGGGGVSVTPLNIPKIPHFFNLLEGVSDLPITDGRPVTLIILVWIRPW